MPKSRDLQNWTSIELPPVRIRETSQEFEGSLLRTEAKEFYRLLVHKKP
ncbi:MAG: hypothetical protein QNK82_15645 [Akkermansiaceae bacterium]